jgi:PD-(D/E)XK nuclease superfamily
MPLTLVLGPANSAKAGEVLGAYGPAARRGALLVVPTAGDARHYTRELAGDGVVLGSVRTFAGLASEIARRAQYAGQRLSALQRERVLRQVVHDAPLSTLGRSAAAPGFAAAAGGLIAELQRSLVTPQRFAQALRAWAAEDPRRAGYGQDLATLYLDYVRALERLGRVDAELYAWRALDALRAAPGRWGADAVFFYGFDELTALERDAVETLSRIAGAEVTVSLTYEPGRVALAARAEAVQELRPLAERVLELPALDEYYAPQSRAVLHHLERWLFEPAGELFHPPGERIEPSTERVDSPSERVESPGGWVATPGDRFEPTPERIEPAGQRVEPATARIDPGRAVRLLEAGGERAEAELVAAEVLDLLRTGLPAEEIVVVFRSLARAPAAIRVFEQYGIPLASGYEIPFGHTALGRGLLGLARCALLDEQRSSAEDLLDYLRSPGLLERPEVVDALEAELRRDGLSSAVDARARLGWPCGEIDSLRDAEDPVAALGRHARRVFAAPYRAVAPTLDLAGELDARALAATLRALSELRELGQPVPGPELVELLERLPIPAGAPAAAGAVLLAEPLEIRARRFRAVFVCGLQEGEFPAPGRPEPFLSDELRRELAACSGLRLRQREDALVRERYLFYACLSRATEQVVLSDRSSDEEGNLALPSPFIDDVAELLVEGWRERRRRRLLADVVWSADGAPTERERARARSAQRAPAAGTVAEPQRLLGPDALRRVRHSQILSAGALEMYAACPVKWLVERELQPERFEPEPDPMARGSFIHVALERVLRRLGGPLTPESLSPATAILDDVLAEMPGTGSDGGVQIAPGRPPALRAAALRAIEADLRRYLETESRDGFDWPPEGLELRFGFDDGKPSLPPLELGEGADRVLVRGMIDRVDVGSGRRAIVRDYKTGAIRPEYQGTHWSSDRQLQVALYMLVVRELLDLEPIAGLYQPLRGDDLRPRGVYLKHAPVGARVVGTDAREPAELDAELQDATARALALAGRLRAGELTPCPQTCSRDGCAFPGICRS